MSSSLLAIPSSYRITCVLTSADCQVIGTKPLPRQLYIVKIDKRLFDIFLGLLPTCIVYIARGWRCQDQINVLQMEQLNNKSLQLQAGKNALLNMSLELQAATKTEEKNMSLELQAATTTLLNKSLELQAATIAVLNKRASPKKMQLYYGILP